MASSIKNNVLWKNCASVTTDRVAAVTGIKKGFQRKVTEVALHMELLLCVTYRQAIAAKKAEPGAHQVLQDDIDVLTL